MILAGYAALQRGILTKEDRWFNLLNFVGSSLLAWIAIVDRRWGFILLEVIWALLSLPPLLRRTIAFEGLELTWLNVQVNTCTFICQQLSSLCNQPSPPAIA